MHKLFLGLIGALGLAGASNAATIDGETVHLFLARPNVSTVEVDFLNRVVGPGPEVGVGLFVLNVSGTSLTLSYAVPAVTALTDPFVGIVLNDVFDAFGDFTSASLTATWLASGTPVVTFDDENVYLNLSGTTFSTGSASNLGEIVRVDFTIADPAPVPLPAALPLLLAGLGALGLIAGRRRA